LDRQYATNFFIRKVVLNQEYLFSETEKESYRFNSEQDFIYERSRDSSKPLWRGFVRLDPITNYARKSSYTISSFVADIGGLAKTLSFICSFLALAITRKTFMQEILQNLFKVKRPIFDGFKLVQGKERAF